MIKNPFPIFTHFPKDLHVELFTKQDHIDADDDLITAGKYSAIVSLNQVHGGNVIATHIPSSRTEAADGVITEIPGLSLCIRVADCQSFVIYDPEHKVLGAVHAGWRGLLAGVIPNFFHLLHKKFHSKPRDIVVAAGPSLCLRCSEFSDPQAELPGIDTAFFHGKLVDLRGIAEKQLHDAGILPELFERHPDCTKCMSSTYFSYRGGDNEAVKSGLSNSVVCTLR